MKKLFIIGLICCSCLFVSTSSIHAEEEAPADAPKKEEAPPAPAAKPSLPPRLQERMDLFNKILTLTDEQQSKIAAVWKDANKQYMTLQSDSSLSADDKKAKGKEVNTASMTKIKEFLTPEQLQKMPQVQAEMSALMGKKKKATEPKAEPKKEENAPAGEEKSTE
jgi:Spy/CpxP family protein refolding chaperone